MGSTSVLPEALIMAWSLSDYGTKKRAVVVSIQISLSFFLSSFLLTHIKFPGGGGNAYRNLNTIIGKDEGGV